MEGLPRVSREVVMGEAALDVAALAVGHPAGSGDGAVVHFLGVVRGIEGGIPIWGLEYTSFERMALRQFDLLVDAAGKRWPVASVRIHHRLGPVRAGEPSLWVEVAAPHRAEAFAACQWIIDEMKRVVPIWKRAVPLGKTGEAGTTR